MHVEYGAMWSGARFRPDDHWRGCLLHIQLCKKPPQKNGQRIRYVWRHVLFSLLNYLTDTKYAPIFFRNLSGSVYGLRLTLNVEQYEYMKGPNDDAGVKVWCDVIESQIDTTCLRSGNSSWVGERTKIKSSFTLDADNAARAWRVPTDGRQRFCCWARHAHSHHRQELRGLSSRHTQI